VFAEFLIEKGLFGEGVQERGRAARLFVSDGDNLFREGRYEEAASAYTRARELDRGNLRSLAGLARCQARMGLKGRALETVERLLLEEEGEADAFSEVLTTLEELAAVHLYDPTAHLLLGVARQKLGQGERAVEVLRRALALEPRYNSNPLLHATMGRALGQLGDLDGARDELEQAASLERENSAVWRELAKVCRELGAEKQAAEAEAAARGMLTTAVREDQWPNRGSLVGGVPAVVKVNTGAGHVRFSLRARGSSANQLPPCLVVRLDNRVVWWGVVDSSTWATYEFGAETLAGLHRLSVEFVNDYEDDDEDRNVVLGQLEVLTEGS